MKNIIQPAIATPTRQTDLLGVRVMFTEDWHTQPVGQPVVSWEDAEQVAKNLIEIQRIVRHLYETRKATAEAKKARAEMAARIGRCEHAEENQSSCYNRPIEMQEWCDVCRQKQPMYNDYQQKSSRSSAALRSILRIAKCLPPIV